MPTSMIGTASAVERSESTMPIAGAKSRARPLAPRMRPLWRRAARRASSGCNGVRYAAAVFHRFPQRPQGLSRPRRCRLLRRGRYGFGREGVCRTSRPGARGGHPPEREAIRRRAPRVQRDDRQTPRRDRPVHGRGGRDRRGEGGPGGGGERRDPRRGPQRPGIRDRGRRPRGGLGPDAGNPCGPRREDGPGGGGVHMGRLQPCHRRVRPRDDGRDHLDDGDRGPHPGGRDRIPDARSRALPR